MTYTELSIPNFLRQVEPFSQLPREKLEQLSKRAQTFRYRMGQSILRRETLPHQVVIVADGKVRLLGYRPTNQLPFTLQQLKEGDCFGWVSLLRGVPCETAIASADPDTLCITIPAFEFLRLMQEEPAIAKHFNQSISRSELAELVSKALQNHAQTSFDLKDLIASAEERATLHTLVPGQSMGPQELPPGNEWWVSGGGRVNDTLPGESLDLNVGQFETDATRPVRLLGLPLSLLDDVAMAAAATVAPPQDAVGSDPWGSGPNGNGKAPGWRESVPFAPDYPQEADAQVQEAVGLITSRGQKKYPFIGGKGIANGTLACFAMLAKHLNLPFRKDVIRRVIGEQLNRGETLPLIFCGAVSEMIGLKTQHAMVPSASIARVQAPALIEWGNSFAVLYETNSREVTLAVPEVGIIRPTPEEFAAQWGEKGEIIMLEVAKETPQQTFGLSWFVPSVVKYRWSLILVLVASLFVQLFGLANPLMIQVIIDRVISKNSVDTLQVLGLFLVVIAVFEAMLSSLRTYLFVDTTNRIDLSLGAEIIDHLFRLPLRYFERRPVGELSSRVGELENIRSFLTGTALTVVMDSIFSVIYIAVMFFYSWKLTLAALGSIPIFVAVTLIFAPIVRKLLRVKAENHAKTQSYLVEALSGVQTVKAQNIELKARWQWQERYARYVSAGFKTVLTSTVASSVSDFLNKMSALLVLCYGAYLVLEGELTLGQMIAFRIISGYVTGPLLRLAQLWQNFQETALSLERLSDIVDTPQEQAPDERDNILMPQVVGKIKYEDVSFRFGNQGAMQLSNVNLEIQPGTFVGIVGQSGSGKSTLTKLLPRLYHPNAGRILVDDYDVGKVELYSLRRQIGIVPQDSLLFEGTVQDNVSLTRPDASSEAIVQAAKVACAHDFIMDLPQAYGSSVGERGSSLSGGQRQRVAIARTILQNPNLLILDEATSALDYDTERQVCLNLMNYFTDRTVLFITHRLPTIQNADLIIVMDKGSIVEMGNHRELMAQRGRYYCLYQQQDQG